MSHNGSRPDIDIIRQLVDRKRKEFESQLMLHDRDIAKRLKQLGVDEVENKPSIKEEFIDLPDGADVSKLSDDQIGRKHFGAGIWLGYVKTQCTIEDVKRTVAKEARDGALADALISAEGGSVDDRRAIASRDPVYRAWNSVYITHLSMYKRLNTLCETWESRVGLYSREITLRTALANAESNKFS